MFLRHRLPNSAGSFGKRRGQSARFDMGARSALTSASMTAQFRWRESDYVAAQWARIKRHPVRIVAGFRYVITVFVILIFAALANAKWRALLALCIGLLVIAVFGLIAQRWRWHLEFKKAPLFRGETSATVDAKSIGLRGANFEATHDWDEFVEVYESARVFLFERANNTFLFFPKASLSESQIGELEKLIAANAKRRRKAPPRK